MPTKRTSERATLSLLQETFFSGDFEQCLAMCGSFKPRDATDGAEVVLLRARCLVQLGRCDQAIDVLRGLRLRDDQHDEYLTGRKSLSIDIASEVLYSDEPLAASRLVTYFAEVMAPTALGNGTEGRQMQADFLLVQGQLEEHRRNRGKAQDSYQRSFDIYRTAGLLRRAAIVAYRLFVLTGEKKYESFVKDALRNASEKYWVKARLTRSRTEARMTPRQLQVVQLVARGMSNKEAGAALGITEARIRNILVVVFRTLGVQNRAELATVATARGLLDQQ